MFVFDTGVAKSATSLAAACLALQDDVDLILIICEQSKLDDANEWPFDVRTFTTISDYGIYHGPRRRKLLEGRLPTVVITTYDIVRQDAAVKISARKFTDGPLLGALMQRRVMVIYDEISVLGRRSSGRYKTHYYMLSRLREKDPDLRVIGLTATSQDTGYENTFSELRLMVPKAMPTVKEFERRVISYRSPDDHYAPHYRPEGVLWFRQVCAPRMIRKRKTDPDVRDEFPRFSEKFIPCLMKGDQRRLYKALDSLGTGDDGRRRELPGLRPLMRQFLGDPLAVREAARAGDSDLARMVWEEWEEELTRCSSAKTEELLNRLSMITGNGYKAIVFTFYGQTVLKVLEERLAAFSLYVYHGQMTKAARERSKAGFRAHQGAAVLLTSDALAKGPNIPEASYVIEHEPARTYSGRVQRAGRAHRLGCELPTTLFTLFTRDTLEDEVSIPRLLRRNDEQDTMLGDHGAEGHVSAADRAVAFAESRKSHG